MDEINKINLSEQTKFRLDEISKIILSKKLIKENYTVKNLINILQLLII